MKKALTFFVLLSYLAVTCGLVVNQHYCMGKHTSSQLFSNTKDLCDKCGMHQKNADGCCHDEVKVIKLAQDQNNNQVSTFDFSLPDDLFIKPSAYIAANFQNADPKRHFQNHLPPLLAAKDIYLQNNAFLI